MKALTAEARRLEAIINTATDGIITIDKKGVIETINPSAARLFAYQPEQVMGKKINILMPSPYHAEHDDYMNNYHRTGKAKIIGKGREVEGLRSDGTVFPFRLAVSEMTIDGQRMYTGVVHDLSDIKAAEQRIMELNRALEEKVVQRTEDLANAVDQLLGTNQLLKQEIEEKQAVENQLREQEQELQQALRKEKELNALKSRFVSMASHEFRTPLSTILSSTELVEMYHKEEQQPKRLRHIDRIKAAVSNLNNILNDFLSLSRLEEGKLDVQLEELELVAFLSEMEDEINLLLKDGQQLMFPSQKEKWVITTDPKILRNILLNLLSNASKYSEKGQTIYLDVEKDETAVTFVIKDEGMGIPKEDQKHLFTRFFRAHNVENIKGTGLGLHIVQQYLDLLKGKIEFTSEMSKGSVFRITLPI
ncbi:PAS domain-containing sensor histidine kinase [Lewinella cohaerens]|uniref:PAS domain-containing sensor histidine kinase n=1 Tax=Lewinella cohaerens TaxID=70995 RepID=UPI0003785F75|nr:PAS domain-containing sensor histidine kinase [Lewinella cohaerens]